MGNRECRKCGRKEKEVESKGDKERLNCHMHSFQHNRKCQDCGLNYLHCGGYNCRHVFVFVFNASCFERTVT
jgi:hypothetical protein